LGNFTAETVDYTFGVGHRYSFAVTDFNGDGTSDIVAARHMLGVDEPGYGFVILYRVPVYSCQGFEAPLNAGPVTVRGKRLLPFRADVLGENGLPLDGSAVATPPLVQVLFVPAGGGTPVDISTGEAFAYIDGKWRFDVRGGDYTIPGSYTVSMLTGNGSEYLIQPTCEATFVVN